jgi:plasmid stabilization system protein ParE
MPQGDKSSYTDKQKRKAEHIEEGYEKRGVSDGEAERHAWATVNKEAAAINLASGRRRNWNKPRMNCARIFIANRRPETKT